MRHAFKFEVHVGHEPDVRRAAGSLPDAVDGLDELHVFLRGNSIFILASAEGDPLEALERDSKGRTLMQTLREHASYDRGAVDAHTLTLHRSHPRERARETEVVAE